MNKKLGLVLTGGGARGAYFFSSLNRCLPFLRADLRAGAKQAACKCNKVQD